MRKGEAVRRGAHRASAIPFVERGEVDRLLATLRPLVDAIGGTIGSHCEVVLHDLRVPERSVVAIANGNVTGRAVGGPLVGGPMGDVALKLLNAPGGTSTLLTGYATKTRDGRELRSTSLLLRTPDGRPAVALCVNVDLSGIVMAKLLLEEMARAPVPGPAPGETGPTAADVMTQMIHDALAEVGKPARFMERDDRLRTVRLLHDRGLFLIRGGVDQAAAALGVSRFTLYSYLKEVRSE